MKKEICGGFEKILKITYIDCENNRNENNRNR